MMVAIANKTFLLLSENLYFLNPCRKTLYKVGMKYFNGGWKKKHIKGGLQIKKHTDPHTECTKNMNLSKARFSEVLSSLTIAQLPRKMII